mmetsp:Transcript_33781/g.51823  ORF Transcript_33781/g.51823 Transcript_33781/m.51823 type:complete len:89 (+) Transcript_33781:565-831(+)
MSVLLCIDLILSSVCTPLLVTKWNALLILGCNNTASNYTWHSKDEFEWTKRHHSSKNIYKAYNTQLPFIEANNRTTLQFSTILIPARL